MLFIGTKHASSSLSRSPAKLGKQCSRESGKLEYAQLACARKGEFERFVEVVNRHLKGARECQRNVELRV